MSEEQLRELQEYNLEYLEAQASEEMFGGDFTSAVELKQAKKEIERLNNIIKKLEVDLRNMYLTFGEFSEEYTEKKIRELKGDDKNDKS